ncbi:MAG: peroxide stress protein YaaA [Gammaproteobacteria bacterium]
MLILISPAKTLDFEAPAKTRTATQPVFLEDAKQLIEELQQLPPDGVSKLMSISSKLGDLNHERFMNWRLPFTKDNAKQSVLAFKGDVYTGLDAEGFSARDFCYAQKHLRILSGLYGVLRPLDLIQPYRLEMGAKFANRRGKDLYQFWDDSITVELNKALNTLKTDAVVNLASNEYFRAVHRKELQADVISPAFKDLTNGKYKILSFYAKKARGQMAGWIIQNGINDAEQLRKFRVAGYRYSADLSTPYEPAFIRDAAPTA